MRPSADTQLRASLATWHESLDGLHTRLHEWTRKFREKEESWQSVLNERSWYKIMREEYFSKHLTAFDTLLQECRELLKEADKAGAEGLQKLKVPAQKLKANAEKTSIGLYGVLKLMSQERTVDQEFRPLLEELHDFFKQAQLVLMGKRQGVWRG